VQEDSEREIASDLGVSKDTVNRAKAELQEIGKLSQVRQFTTSKKKQQVRAYLNQNPDASFSQSPVAAPLNNSHPL